MVIGRFAPSPTGPLHAGSLVAALGSFLHAKHRGGEWRLRIDDIDPPRAVPGAAEAIITSLQAHGLAHDGNVDWQSDHSDSYQRALATLEQKALLFTCQCTRSTLGEDGSCERDCADKSPIAGKPCSLRVKVPRTTEVAFTDSVLGTQRWVLGERLRNFIVRRRDGLFAYQLAAAVDDTPPDITEVVRGGDLLSSTPRQVYLQHVLDLPSPVYGHLPVVTNSCGDKLSKQTGAAALDDRTPVANLRAALAVLGQVLPPPNIDTVDALLAQATASWDIFRVPR